MPSLRGALRSVVRGTGRASGMGSGSSFVSSVRGWITSIAGFFMLRVRCIRIAARRDAPGAHEISVRAAAAQIATECALELRVSWMRILAEQRLQAHDLPRRAE